MQGLLLVTSLWLAVSKPSLPCPEMQGLDYPGRERMDRAYRSAVAANDLATFRAEIADILQDPDSSRRGTPVTWLGQRICELSPEDAESLILFVRETATDAWIRRSLAHDLMELRLQRMPREERADLYWAAVKQGAVSPIEGWELSRYAALARAAFEGLEEFRPAIEANAPEFDDHPAVRGVRLSVKLLWFLEISAGAEDAEDATRIHAERIEQLADAELASKMYADVEFRFATLDRAAAACARASSDNCPSFRNLLDRQLRHRRGSAGAKPSIDTNRAPTGSPAEVDWLRLFAINTGRPGSMVDEPLVPTP